MTAAPQVFLLKGLNNLSWVVSDEGRLFENNLLVVGDVVPLDHQFLLWIAPIHQLVNLFELVVKFKADVLGWKVGI